MSDRFAETRAPEMKAALAEIERLREALVWEVKMGHTTAVPPVSVQHTMNGIRVSVGEQPWPVRTPTPPLIDAAPTRPSRSLVDWAYDQHDGTPISEQWSHCPKCHGLHAPQYRFCDGLRPPGIDGKGGDDAPSE